MCTADGQGLGSVAEALRMTRAGLDYLNGPAGDDLDAAACGLVLRSLGERVCVSLDDPCGHCNGAP